MMNPNRGNPLNSSIEKLGSIPHTEKFTGGQSRLYTKLLSVLVFSKNKKHTKEDRKKRIKICRLSS